MVRVAGTVFGDDLDGVSPSAQRRPWLTRIVEASSTRPGPRRARSQQGDFGRVLIVGSGSGHAGRGARLQEACLRVGAGLTMVAVAPENVASL